MEIERINENTIKFYISYMDIEDRGFEREEIWYSRERSEQLFWQMMEEVNNKEDFTVDGPLWIQVQALEKGLEVIVTKAQISKNGENLELPVDDEDAIDVPVEQKIENLLESKFGSSMDKSKEVAVEEEGNMWFIVNFDAFENVIQLSHYLQETQDDIDEKLYYYKDKYHLYVEFPEDGFDEAEQENFISKVLEFANDSKTTIHLLEAYGKAVFENDTFAQVRSYFPAEL